MKNTIMEMISLSRSDLVYFSFSSVIVKFAFFISENCSCFATYSYNCIFGSLSLPQSVVHLVPVITVTLWLWSLAAENVLWQLVHSNIWLSVCSVLLVHWSWRINTFPAQTNTIMCIWVFGKPGFDVVCGNARCVFSEITCIQWHCLLGDRRPTKAQTDGSLRSVTRDGCRWDIVVEINATVNKADRVKIAHCIPAKAPALRRLYLNAASTPHFALHMYI